MYYITVRVNIKQYKLFVAVKNSHNSKPGSFDNYILAT